MKLLAHIYRKIFEGTNGTWVPRGIFFFKIQNLLSVSKIPRAPPGSSASLA